MHASLTADLILTLFCIQVCGKPHAIGIPALEQQSARPSLSDCRVGTGVTRDIPSIPATFMRVRQIMLSRYNLEDIPEGQINAVFLYQKAMQTQYNEEPSTDIL